MAAKEKESEGKEGEAAPAKKSKKKLIFIVVGVVLLAVGVGVPMMLGGEKVEEEEEAAHEEPPKVYKQMKIDSFIVNLSEQKNFLKVSMLVEYDPEIVAKMGGQVEGGGHGGGSITVTKGSATGGGGAGGGAPDPFAVPVPLAEKMPIIRDSIIKVLSSRKAAEVLTPEGKLSLKEEVVETINDAIGFEEPPITNIYFTEFIVQ